MSGLDRLLAETHFPHPGAQVGLLGHHASVNAQGQHAVDCLRQRPDWKICKLFSPEHGFSGQAAPGEKVENSLHPQWDLPVYSLYGEHRSPPAAWLADIDLMVVDLQDLGVRCYTYASTLLLMMRACAKIGLPMLVLDRATPLAGLSDGPDLDPKLQSFVGMIDLPLVFGLGQGELSTFLKTHHSELRNLDLKIFWDSGTSAADQKWIPPSPAIVTPASARLYPVTVWSEAIPAVDVDRGESASFGMWMQPDFPAALLTNPPIFKGMSAAPVERRIDEKTWRGLVFAVEDFQVYRPIENAVILLCALRDELGAARLFDVKGARPCFFDQLMGCASVRKKIIAGAPAESLVADWQK